MASHDVPRATRPRTEVERQQELVKIDKYRSLEDQFRQQVVLSYPTKQLRPGNPAAYSKALASQPGILYSMERSQTLSNLWTIIQAIGWVVALEGVVEFFSERQSHTLFRRIVTLLLERDPASPRAPDSWVEWYTQGVIRSELVFIVPLLMQHPKCYWIWNYRVWILGQAIELLSVSDAKAIWEEELALVGKMLHKDRRNYHAWAYRRHVVGQLEGPPLAGQSMVETEFQYTTKMIKMDLSNFSAWHNRSQLICRLLDERASNDVVRRKLLDDEFNLVRDGLNVGPEDQSLWYYHQFLVSNLVEKSGRPSMVPRLTIKERISYIHNEIDAIKELLEDYDDIKWIYEVLIEYTIAARQLDNHSSEERESDEVARWLRKLRELDPMRNGRWNDLANDVGLA
ncbi:Geranylgeranyl transferase type-2 subunit alpha [Cladobotryum mycophilum]|uniref:Geranylgeranyl transferase type-2 subunit alpha n=1 Tax=Cladobotryum mycophilum TaxID=491253 RepID=A0ABR0SZ42_9HYPO